MLPGISPRFIAAGHRFQRHSAFQIAGAVRHNESTEALALVSQSATSQPQTQRRLPMKTFVLAALLGISSLAGIAAPASADSSFSVHGVFGGNTYGGR